MKQRSLDKHCWDKDYNELVYSQTIHLPEQVEDNWSGESFHYHRWVGNQSEVLSADQAREYLKGAD